MSAQMARAVFAAEGIRCAACSRSIEAAVRALRGVLRVNVNAATSRVAVDWLPGEIDLPQIFAAVDAAGFKPVPLAGEAAEAAFQRERRAALKRIGLAGLGMMQVMMYVLGVYVAAPGEIEPAIAAFLNYTAMVITLPVLLYSGAPFLQGAIRGVRSGSLNMDVTVALALVLAFGASAFNTLRGRGETYFDSVSMFIFFLSVGRYAEMVVRNRSLSISEALSRSLPATVLRVGANGASERIPTGEIRIGDRLRIPKGAVIPADARLQAESARIDESLITGESTPLQRRAGDLLPGGSVNAGNAIVVSVEKEPASSVLASIVALLERAQRERPVIAITADRIAGRFIAGILSLALLVALAWLYFDPSRAFPAVLAVLVVTCPCALSLATPAAVAAATIRLAKDGLMVTRADAIERLARIDTVVLDKTGTLTAGALEVAHVELLSTLQRSEVLSIAAALERSSSHPVASAFAPFADSRVWADDVQEREGLGVEGHIDGVRWRLGQSAFAIGGGADARGDRLILANEHGPVAAFEMREALRADAAGLVGALRDLGITTVMASGDRVESVQRAAQALGIERALGRVEPQQKIALVRELQANGHRVLMVGDGINDGPVLAAADASCAMGQGSAIAQAAADFLLLGDSIRALVTGIQTARRMRSIVRQNLQWALVYNFAAVPLAALGWVPPWLAAIGMSASSLVVVLNARRLAAEGKNR